MFDIPVCIVMMASAICTCVCVCVLGVCAHVCIRMCTPYAYAHYCVCGTAFLIDLGGNVDANRRRSKESLTRQPACRARSVRSPAHTSAHTAQKEAFQLRFRVSICTAAAASSNSTKEEKVDDEDIFLNWRGPARKHFVTGHSPSSSGAASCQASKGQKMIE